LHPARARLKTNIPAKPNCGVEVRRVFAGMFHF
jgi:hypothetical protein